jgi:hypothetical protein
MLCVARRKKIQFFFVHAMHGLVTVRV